MNKITTFFKEVKMERKATTWPSFKEMKKNTNSVLTIIVLFSLFFYVTETGITWLLSFIF